MEVKEGLTIKAKYEIFKFRGDYRSFTEALKKEGQPYAHEVFYKNIALNEGINELWTLVCGTGATKFDNTNARVGVGDSTTAAAATQTGLQAVTNKAYKPMDGGYPTYGTSQQAVWQGTFGAAEANFAWEEYTVVNAADDTGKNLFRKVENKGTKNGGSWTLRITATAS